MELGELIAAALLPTKDQAERMERAAEEQQTQAAAKREAAEKEAAVDCQQFEQNRQQRRDDRSIYDPSPAPPETPIATVTTSATTTAGESESVEPPRIEAIPRRQNREPPNARLSRRRAGEPARPRAGKVAPRRSDLTH